MSNQKGALTKYSSFLNLQNHFEKGVLKQASARLLNAVNFVTGSG
jgi:hypothetical protein